MGIVKKRWDVKSKSPYLGAFFVKSNIIYFLLMVLLTSELFLVLPWLGDPSKSSKIFPFIFVTCIFSIVYLNSNDRIHLSQTTICYALLLVLFTFFSFFSYNSFSSFLTTGFLFVGLIFHLCLTDFLLVNPQMRLKVLDWLLLLGTVSATLGLYEFISYKLLGQSSSMLIPYLLPPNTSLRVGGMFGQPNLFSVFLQMVLLVFFYRYIHTDTFTKAKGLSCLPLGLVAVVFFLTGSRAGLLSFTLIVCFLAWLVARGIYLRADILKKKRFIVVLLIVILAFATARILTLGEMDGRTFSAVGISSDARFVFWTSAILMFLDRPWIGQGLSTYGLLQNSYNPLAHKFLGFVQYEAMGNTNWAHNELLQLLAEGGILVFLLIAVLLFFYLWKLKSVSFSLEHKHQYFYSFLFLIPFIVQSMFSWTFRYPPLFVLFLMCVSILLSQSNLTSVHLGKKLKITLNILLLVVFVSGLFFLKEDVKIRKFKVSIKKSPTLSYCFSEFSMLAEANYSSYKVVSRYAPDFIAEAMKSNDLDMARKILPYAEWLTQIEGTGVQWYNLAQLYLFLDERLNSEAAIRLAIDMLPHDNRLWDFLHYLNMLTAAEKTGRPLEYFLPIPQSGTTDDVMSLLNFDGYK